MESLVLIKYKWEQGVYSFDDMIKLVEEKKISEEDFFKITRFNYKGVLEKQKHK